MQRQERATEQNGVAEIREDCEGVVNISIGCTDEDRQAWGQPLAGRSLACLA